MTAPQRTRTGRVLTERTYEVPYKLPPELSPNGRAHWRTKARLTSQIRWAAAMTARANPIAITGNAVRYRVEVGLTNRQWAKNPDGDNVAANLALKAARDGFADALTDHDDSEWECLGVTAVKDPANKGFIRFVISAG